MTESKAQGSGRIVVVVYEPFPGKEPELEIQIKKHLPVLWEENLATNREPIVMKSKDGLYIEIFEWKSAEAIKQALSNRDVNKLWEEFSKICTYREPVTIDEFRNLFSEFEPVN